MDDISVSRDFRFVGTSLRHLKAVLQVFGVPNLAVEAAHTRHEIKFCGL